MKKFITAAAFAATLGAASSVGFAAANPFEDVPADHWANEAIRQLAADGVIEGYGDGTYRGEQQITRYEVAQIVARAMAKEGVSAADKAAIDKLSAEFAGELEALGVRVSALEKKVDNVKINGFLGYHFWDNRVAGEKNHNKYRENTYEFQLNVKAQVNNNWAVRSRMKLNYEADNASTGANSTKCVVDRAWAVGQYGNTTIELGKLPYTTMQDNGMIIGNRITGAAVTTGNKLQVKLSAGRVNTRPNLDTYDSDATADIQGIELNYKASKAVSYGAAYFHLTNDGYKNNTCRFQPTFDAGGENYGSDQRNIWEIGGHWRFAPKWDLNLAYAKNNGGNWDNKYQQAYNIEFTYNGGRYPDVSKPGNFGAFIAYRYLGRGALIYPVYDGIYQNGKGTQKGIEVGACYVFEKNLTGTVLYFRGKDLTSNEGDVDSSTLYTLLQAWF